MANTAAAEAEFAQLQATLESAPDAKSFSSGLPLQLDDGLDDEAADAIVAKEEEAQAQAWSNFAKSGKGKGREGKRPSCWSICSSWTYTQMIA